MEERKNLEVVSGDGSNLDISRVHDHLNTVRPKSSKEKPTNIVIPKEADKTDKNDTEKKDTKEEEN